MKIEEIRTGWFKQKWSFRIKASNGKVIATSEKYYNYKDMKDTICLLQKDLPTAELIKVNKIKP